MIDALATRDMLALPIGELTGDELAALHHRYAKSGPYHFTTADLSDEAFTKSVAKASECEGLEQLRSFVEGQTAMASALRSLSEDRGSIGADELICETAGGWLERNAMAGLVTLRDYESFLTSISPEDEITPSNAVDHLCFFYSKLSGALLCAGLEWGQP